MCVQTNREFDQNAIKISTKNITSKCSAQECLEGKHLLIRGLKKLLFKAKSLNKRLEKRIKPNKLIAKAKNNINSIKSESYDLAPEEIEVKS